MPSPFGFSLGALCAIRWRPVRSVRLPGGEVEIFVKVVFSAALVVYGHGSGPFCSGWPVFLPARGRAGTISSCPAASSPAFPRTRISSSVPGGNSGTPPMFILLREASLMKVACFCHRTTVLPRRPRLLGARVSTHKPSGRDC